MPITITMPALSPTMTEGRIARWFKAEGEEVIAGDVLAEIETDKATMEIEAIDDGILGKILIPGETDGVAVNTPIALILEEGEDVSSMDGFTANAPVVAVAGTAAESSPAPTASAPVAADPAPVATPVPTSGQRIIASPLARRIAADSGLDLALVKGSGPRGRIVKADVLGAQGTAKSAPAIPAAPATPVVIPPTSVEPTEIPLTNMRKTIAKRLVAAKQDIPHIYLTIECELDALLALRKQVNERRPDTKVSVNDFIVKASALALKQVPAVNASWTDTAVIQYNTVDISIAVAIEGGLITPIVRNADLKGLAAISAEVKELAGRAKESKLMPEEYQGGGFSISNLGMFGIKEFSAIINPPQSAILAVGAGEQRPVVKNGALSIATVMSCTMSCDHRVVDGALGAQWLAAFKGYIEDPLGMLL
ncbi:MAG: pyruvate dehydrogenase complex dihydrolipoamide acetyltransferase [Alphaproteobacteria bacterium]|jgi:pyruvate dehydrogenase E2 component (dihydrolipoamide acetyltransferase)|nr:pyruvate dehydrogenase complex dihydrolipoamide acetyltransferase [Alphaproteobacteria bacterium]MBT4083915.1 pyruvate dehydrogenase complex dihydrolipoamide acetyltransferase [Alphaproteobacteria bacterium]MBT4546217.1 pyruvate dehydrogenase complex dihydrolipoamide acetyltransferase [Alphaproteobacteria bacterium]MBT7746516.1 pyruvate dehydrogenase complex dihydrolipoamide acetyltransferase [Alphaproteobacteria bacterium]